MELQTQIRKYRKTLNLSQEELAENICDKANDFQLENGKSYPDIHSLILLSSLFSISIDQLIKGDLETMKELVNEQELKKFNLYGNILSIHFVLLTALSVPLFIWLIQYAFFPFGFLFILTMYRALKVEKIKKENDVQTYKEILAFTEEKKLDEITKMVEKGKRPYQNILKVLLSAFITAILCFLIGFLIHIIQQ